MCNLRNSIIVIIILTASLIIFLPFFFSSVSIEHNFFAIPNRPFSPSPVQFNLGLSNISKSYKNPFTLPLLPAAAWVIQVADFKARADADALVHRLRQQGFKAYTRQIVRSGGINLTRVFIGPEIKLKQIKGLVTRLDKEMQFKSAVVTAFDPLLL